MKITYKSGSFASGSTATTVTKDGENVGSFGCSGHEAVGSLLIKLVEMGADTSNLTIEKYIDPKQYDYDAVQVRLSQDIARRRSLNKRVKNDLTNKKTEVQLSIPNKGNARGR